LCGAQNALAGHNGSRVWDPALKIIERYFEDYKTQIKNKLTGIGQSTNGRERENVRPQDNVSASPRSRVT